MKTMVAIALAASIAAPASALSTRTFVSAQRGSDANVASNCSNALPCRTFAAAVTATSPGGEVVALDSAGYGAVTIDRSLALVSPRGVAASITAAPAANAITIAVAADDLVTLRGLTLIGGGSGSGISATAGAVAVEDCRIGGFLYGLDFSGSGAFHVSASTFVGNGNGIFVAGSGDLTGTVIRTTFFRSDGGVNVFTNATVNVIDSSASHGAIAFRAGTSARLNCTRCNASANSIYGMSATGTGIIRMSACSVTSNNIGVSGTTGGTCTSMNDNFVRGNGTDWACTVTRVPLE